MDVVAVVRTDTGHALQGTGPITEVSNGFLGHLEARAFSPGTIQGYAFDLLNFSRFLVDRGASLDDVVPTDLFDYLAWQAKARPTAATKVVRLADRRGAAPATMNRRIAAVRGLFEYAVITGLRTDNPVPAARRSTGLRPKTRGMLGHIAPRRPPTGGRLVRQFQRLPESLDHAEVAAFIADLSTARDRAMTLAMLVGGLRAAEVRSLLLADVDMGLRRVRIMGKGGRERGCVTPECFVVLRGPTTGNALSEAGMRRIFRTHRARSEATRVRPHRLRHTYGTELATAGIDLLVLRELMGHTSPETTASYVHLSAETLAAEFAKAREASR